jgi:soluble lytic murein transglycosylase
MSKLLNRLPKSWIPWLLGGAGTIALVSGMVISSQVQLGNSGGGPVAVNGKRDGTQPGTALANALRQSGPQRLAALQQLAQAPQASPDRARARYVLAGDRLQAKQPQPALALLEQLEQDYPLLAPQILQQRARAFTDLNQADQAKATWQELLQRHGQTPAAAEALYALGQQEPQYWQQAIAQFPRHPRTVAIAKQLLKKNPKQLPLLLLLAQAEPDAKGTPERLDQLVQNFGAQLKPEDWQTVAFAYWESQKYDKAAKAYAKVVPTPQSLYRSARGLHLSGEVGSRPRYELVIKQFPGTPEAGLALLRLGQLSEPLKAMPYFDQVIANYPDRAPEALLEKAKLLEKLNNGLAATQARQALFDRFPKSKAAAEQRWKLAQERLKAGDLKGAQQWAALNLEATSDAEYGAKSGFWAGKWALKIGNSPQAGQHFQQVIKLFPESYYAWRSASLLGWNVGDFNTVRPLQPTIQPSVNPPQLLAGSPTLRELQQLGQGGDAWAYWQTEFTNRLKPTVNEQFTDGILRLAVGDNLDGIYMLSSLADREIPAEQQQYQALKSQRDYWQGLYPFPFVTEIAKWAQQHRLNPMLVTALIRQESRFEPQIKSVVGATGLMQVMPETAEGIAEQLSVKNYNLENPEDNIRFGTWYLGSTHDQYQENSMLAIASYNAGPNAVGEWVAKNKIQDADEFVEAIPYDETRGYVRSVLGNYWNYLRLYNPEIAQKVAQISPQQPPI